MRIELIAQHSQLGLFGEPVRAQRQRLLPLPVLPVLDAEIERAPRKEKEWFVVRQRVFECGDQVNGHGHVLRVRPEIKSPKEDLADQQPKERGEDRTNERDNADFQYRG